MSSEDKRTDSGQPVAAANGSLHRHCSASDHELCHEFSDWLDEQRAVRPSVAWRGKVSGLETFVGWATYTKTYFREWALSRQLPADRWKAVYREYIND